MRRFFMTFVQAIVPVRIFLLFSLIFLGLLSSVSLSKADTLSAGSSCEIRGQTSNEQMFYNCKPPQRARLLPFQGRNAITKCESFCGTELLSSDNGIVANPTPNTAWLAAFQQGNFRTGDVYTDILLDIDDASLSAQGERTCEAYGLTQSFFSNLVGYEKARKISISLVISDKRISRRNTTDLSNLRGFVHNIFSIERDITSGTCTARAETGFDGRIARVRAEQGKELFLSVLYFSEVDTKPLSRIAAGSAADSTDIEIQDLLNGALEPYAQALGVIANNVMAVRQTELVSKKTLSVYPLSNTGEPGEFDKLDYEINIGSKVIARFTVSQSADIDPEGPLEGYTNFFALIPQDVLVAQNFGVTGQSIDTFGEAFIGTGFQNIIDQSTYTTVSGVRNACEQIERALGNFRLSNRAEERLRALMLASYIRHGTDQSNITEFLKSPGGEDLCVDNDVRKARHMDLLSATVVGGDFLQGVQTTCMSFAEDKRSLTDAVTRSSLRTLRTQGSELTSFTGDRYREVVPEGSDETKEQLVQKLTRDRTCAMWSNIDDDPSGVLVNKSCRFVFLGRARGAEIGQASRPVWIGVYAGGDRNRQPEAQESAIGIDLKNFVTFEALQAHGEACLSQGSQHFSQIVATREP
ncbi:MAG: hypothetical protein ABJL99_19740 [Aliishimia sp.]